MLNEARLEGGNEARVPAGTSTPPTACTSEPTTLLRPTVHLLVVTRTRPWQRPEGFTTVLTLLLDTEVLGQLLHEVALDLQAVVVTVRKEVDDIVHVSPLYLHCLAEPKIDQKRLITILVMNLFNHKNNLQSYFDQLKTFYLLLLTRHTSH